MRKFLNFRAAAFALALGPALACCSVPPAPPPDAAPPPVRPDAGAADMSACTGMVCTGSSGLPECVADLNTDPDHCGSCDNRCPNAEQLHEPHSYPSCLSGACTVNCAPPYAGCGTVPGQFCQDIQTSPKDCGGCNQACTAPHPSCVAGACE